MRTKKSLINVAISCSSYLICMIGTFIIRGMFNRILGEDYAGIESTFLNAVAMLAVVELGIGTGIVYKLYKPIADGDNVQIAKLLKFYKNAYSVIALAVFSIGVVVAVIIPFAINEDYSHLWLSLIFLLYLGDTLASYLFANRRAMFVADQKNYIATLCYTGAQFINLVLQVLFLTFFVDVLGAKTAFAVYLIIKIAVRLIENCSIAYLFSKKYPQIDLKSRQSIGKEERSELFLKIRALMVHKVAGLSLQATSSLIVTKLVDVVRGGFYGNYISLSNAINTIGTQFFNGITASFGDLYVSVDKSESYRKFKCIFFVNYLMYSFFAVSYFIVSKPFIELWIGTGDAVFSSATVALMSIYIYMYGIRQCIFVARNVTGEYTKDKWYAVIEALLNFAVGALLVWKIGVIGIPIGNIVSILAIPFWVQSRIVYCDIFGVKLREYYKSYFAYMLVFLFCGAVCYLFCESVETGDLLIDLIVRLAVCATVPNLINVVCFIKTPEFAYVKNAAASVAGKLIKK